MERDKGQVEMLKRRLREYLEAESAILRGAEYQLGDRRLRRADLAEVRQGIEELKAELRGLELKHGRRKRVVFEG